MKRAARIEPRSGETGARMHARPDAEYTVKRMVKRRPDAEYTVKRVGKLRPDAEYTVKRVVKRRPDAEYTVKRMVKRSARVSPLRGSILATSVKSCYHGPFARTVHGSRI